MEEMKDVIGFEGIYAITKTGRIWSCPRKFLVCADVRRGAYIKSAGGYFLQSSLNPYGYFTVVLRKTGNHYTRFIHRMVAQAFIENPENLPQVNHKDGVKINNDIENLEWCTQQANIAHAWDTGLMHKPRKTALLLIS